MPADTPSSRRPRRATGRQRRPREDRGRILRAARELVCERGTQALTADDVCARAGCSQARFRELFADRDDLLVALFDDLAERAEQLLGGAYRGQEDWRCGVRAALTRLLQELERRPELARFLLVDAATGEPPLPARRARLLGRLAHALEAGRPRPDAGSAPVPFGAEAVVGAVASILHGRLQEPGAPRLTELAGPLMGMIVLPYLGAPAAREEVSRPHGVARGEPDVRLAARTLAALQAIAAAPGMNNREVASAAGIADAGQASRMLARLCRLGLIESERRPPRRARANSWRLTAAGRELMGRAGRRATAAGALR
jgi:AcrR family transcriptional regulator